MKKVLGSLLVIVTIAMMGLAVLYANGAVEPMHEQYRTVGPTQITKNDVIAGAQERCAKITESTGYATTFEYVGKTELPTVPYRTMHEVKYISKDLAGNVVDTLELYYDANKGCVYNNLGEKLCDENEHGCGDTNAENTSTEVKENEINPETTMNNLVKLWKEKKGLDATTSKLTNGEELSDTNELYSLTVYNKDGSILIEDEYMFDMETGCIFVNGSENCLSSHNCSYKNEDNVVMK